MLGDAAATSRTPGGVAHDEGTDSLPTADAPPRPAATPPPEPTGAPAPTNVGPGPPADTADAPAATGAGESEETNGPKEVVNIGSSK